MTRRQLCAASLSAVLCSALPAGAALPVGAAAPDFTTEAALAGQPFKFSLADALKKGPVVLYFYPKAFTSGCTVEAHAFAEATPRFQAAGATVIGMSNDDIETLKKFSVEACRDKFAVAADRSGQIMKRYDAALGLKPDLADRVSYVISPQGKILYVYASLNPDGHVQNTLKAVEAWKREAAR
ncbi:peroxiredoxin [Caldimonas brevitalea]|nr:peroxiredoxin [Caldimonas brevitalea]